MTASFVPQAAIRRLPEGPFWAMTWGWMGVRGTWSTPAAIDSMTQMLEIKPNWVVLAYAAMQDTAQSTEIHWRDAPTVTDQEILDAAARARALGLRVCLKPIVNVADGTWRAHIGFFDVDVPCEPTWTSGSMRMTRTSFTTRAWPRPVAQICSPLAAKWCGPTPARIVGATSPRG